MAGMLRRRAERVNLGRDTVTAMTQNLYPTDHPEPEFPDQSNHSLAAAAENPFLITTSQVQENNVRTPFGSFPTLLPCSS
jgi:hypothetical protein